LIIYSYTNIINGKKYIGKTINSFRKRNNDHCSAAKTDKNNCHFYNAIRKYGRNSFITEILEKVNTIEDLNDREIYWIAYHDSFNNGYNMTKGGDGGLGIKGRKLSPEHLEKLTKVRNGNKNWLGKKHTEETLTKMRKPKSNTDNMHKPKSKEHKEAIRIAKLKKKLKILETGGQLIKTMRSQIKK